mgnify:CR=1 FL=1
MTQKRATWQKTAVFDALNQDPIFVSAQELHQKLFGEGFEGAHHALADVRACARCYFELVRLGVLN